MRWTLSCTVSAPAVKMLVNMRVTELQVSDHQPYLVGNNSGIAYALLDWPDLSSVAKGQSACVSPQVVTTGT